MVSSTGNSPWWPAILHGRWHVVCWMYLCRNVYPQTHLSWWFRNRWDLQDIPVCSTAYSPRRTFNHRFSLLGTPDENTWPGVTSFPDFKSSFPKWYRDHSRAIVGGLEENGLDLLDAMLVYDPAGRISAKQACQHPYFELGGSSAYSGRGRPSWLRWVFSHIIREYPAASEGFLLWVFVL